MSIYWTASLIAGACVAAFITVLAKIAIQTTKELKHFAPGAHAHTEEHSRATVTEDHGYREGAALEATTAV